MDDVKQGTPEWHEARLGKVTASRIADLTARTKTGWRAGRKNYMSELIAERLTKTPADSFCSPAMDRGKELEQAAIEAYEFYKSLTVERVGFVNHPTIKMSGASPDGLVGEKGLVEIKCPNTATHLDTILKNRAPTKYLKQMHWQMICTGREWCDFVSYDPRLPEYLSIWAIRVHMDYELMNELEAAVRDFLSEMDDIMGKLPPDPVVSAKVVLA